MYVLNHVAERYCFDFNDQIVGKNMYIIVSFTSHLKGHANPVLFPYLDAPGGTFNKLDCYVYMVVYSNPTIRDNWLHM